MVKKSVQFWDLFDCKFIKFIENNDVFSVNDNFTSKLMRIKIHPVPMERSEAEQNKQREMEETQNMVFIIWRIWCGE